MKWAAAKGINVEDYAAVLNGRELKQAIIEEMEAQAKEKKLTGLERVKHVFLSGEAFSIANDLTTPTFKTKRNAARKVFEKQIKDLYAEAH